MKKIKLFSGFFGLLGACAAAAGIYLAFSSMHASPVLLTPPEAAREQVEIVLDAVCAGDYAAAGREMYGTPDLGVDRDAADEVGILIWNAFVDSLSYELEGDCYATDSGVAQDVTITCLDIDSVTANLRERSQTLLEQRVANAEDTAEVYAEGGEYREDVVMAVLYEAAQQALEEDAAAETVQLQLNLVYSGEQWWVLPETGLLNVISGGLVQ